MSITVKKTLVGKKTDKTSLANKAKSVGSPESKPSATATEQIARSHEYQADAKALMEALWAVEPGEGDVADRRGELVHPVIMKLRDGHYGKMANGTDPFKKLAIEPGCPFQPNRFGGFSIGGISP